MGSVGGLVVINTSIKREGRGEENSHVTRHVLFLSREITTRSMHLATNCIRLETWRRRLVTSDTMIDDYRNERSLLRVAIGHVWCLRLPRRRRGSVISIIERRKRLVTRADDAFRSPSPPA